MAAVALAIHEAEKARIANTNKDEDFYGLFADDTDTKKKQLSEKVSNCFRVLCLKKSTIHPENEATTAKTDERPPDYYANPAYWSKTPLIFRWYLYLAYTFQKLASNQDQVIISKPATNNVASLTVSYAAEHSLTEYGVDGKLLRKMTKLEKSEVASELGITMRALQQQLESARRLSDSFNNFITLTIIVAGINVGIQTYPNMDSDPLIVFLDWAILLIFSFEMAVKIVMEGFAPWRCFTGPDWMWNIFDSLIIVLSYPIPLFQAIFGGNSIALLRLVRVARLGKLINKIPALRMIIQGLLAGMSSIRYVVVLLILIFYLYGVIGYYLFARNDPFHFGTLSMAMFTLFRLACLDNWTDIMYLNVYGCDQYPDIYVSPPVNATDASNSINPMFYCTHPETNYVVGTLYFLSFVIISALVMLSLFIGAVTVAMVDNMEELKRMVSEKKAEASKALNQERSRFVLKMAQKDQKKKAVVSAALIAKRALEADSSTSKRKFVHVSDKNDDLDDEFKHDDEDEDSDDEEDVEKLQSLSQRRPWLCWYYAYRIFLARYKERDALRIKEEMAVNLKIALGKEDKLGGDLEEAVEIAKNRQTTLEKGYLQMGKLFSYILGTSAWQNTMTVIIIVASLLVGMQTDYRITRYQTIADLMDAVDILILLIFTGEIGLKIIALGFHPLHYFREPWNNFDLIIVIGSWIPGTGGTIVLLRLLRLLRVLKLIKRLPQLAVIINALINGMSSIGYIGLVLLLFFYVGSIIAMLLFSESDPWHFTYLHRAFLTLFKAVTLDGWSEDSYTLIYGCEIYPGVYVDYPSECVQSEGKGFTAVPFYLVLILIGTQVLLSLFIGVISTSMEDSRAAQLAEQELDRRLMATAKKIMLTPERVAAFKVVFHLLDLDGSGTVDLEELKEGLASINATMSDSDIMDILMSIDPEGEGLDVNGFINFMTETPLFSKGNQMVKLLRAFNTFGGNHGLKKSHGRKASWWRVLLDWHKWIQPFTDLLHGGKAAREHMDEMYAALLIQDAWMERKASRKAQSEAKAKIEKERTERLMNRLAVQRHIEQSSDHKRIVRDGRKYNEDGEFVADVL